MSAVPRMAARALIAALEKAGFRTARVRGSHHILKHLDGRMTVVPMHSGETLGPGLMAKILRDCRISPDQLRQLL